ncbi:unnamed protein product, partial [Echinostoma caproni]|uniref:Tetraspanin n=1 Tax=Echinostoma caproni TaxID=27848 RepID=A0A183A584_9TREM
KSIFGFHLSEDVNSLSSGRGRETCCTRCGWLQPISIILLIIFLGQIASLIWLRVLQTEISDPDDYFYSRVTNLFVESKISYWGNPEHKPTYSPSPFQEIVSTAFYPDSALCWHMIQETFHCCGASSYTDWLVNITMNATVDDYLKQLPETCSCPREQIGDEECYKRPIVKVQGQLLYTTGCIQPLSRKLSNLYTSGIVVIPCTVCLLLISFLCDLIYTLHTAHLVLQLQDSRQSILLMMCLLKTNIYYTMS